MTELNLIQQFLTTLFKTISDVVVPVTIVTSNKVFRRMIIESSFTSVRYSPNFIIVLEAIFIAHGEKSRNLFHWTAKGEKKQLESGDLSSRPIDVISIEIENSIKQRRHGE